MADDLADADGDAAVLGRLEAALDRIARRATALPPPPAPENGAVAARLDRLIAQLRGALADATEA